MSAIVPANGPTRQLDQQPEPLEQITETQVSDATRLARVLMTILRDLATLKRRHWPQYVDHEDRVVDATGTAPHRFAHGFKTVNVRYWAVRWTGATAPCLRLDPSSDRDTLVLTSTVAGTVTVRVEAGA